MDSHPLDARWNNHQALIHQDRQYRRLFRCALRRQVMRGGLLAELALRLLDQVQAQHPSSAPPRPLE